MSNTFVGREAELELLHAAFERTTGGRSELVMLVGKPGVGKTRLAERWAAAGRLPDSFRCGEAVLFGLAPGLTPHREVPPKSLRFRVCGRRSTSMSASFANEEAQEAAFLSQSADDEQNDRFPRYSLMWESLHLLVSQHRPHGCTHSQ